MITVVYEDGSDLREMISNGIRYAWEMAWGNRTRAPLTFFAWLKQETSGFDVRRLKCSPVFSLRESLEGLQREGHPCQLLIGRRYTSALGNRLVGLKDAGILPPKMLVFSDHPVPAPVAHLPGIQFQRESLAQEYFLTLVKNLLAIAHWQSPDSFKQKVFEGLSAVILWHEGSRNGLSIEMIKEFFDALGFAVVTLCTGHGALIRSVGEREYHVLLCPFAFDGSTIETLMQELIRSRTLPQRVLAVVGNSEKEAAYARKVGAHYTLSDPLLFNNLRVSLETACRTVLPLLG